MSRRNLYWMLAILVVSVLCYQKVQRNRYGETLAYTIDLVERRALEPVSSERLFQGGMQGVMARIGDEYSAYIPPEEKVRFDREIKQEMTGVGMQVVLDPKTRQITVGSPMFGSPAQRAGIRAGDRILRIDDKSTQGLSLEDAVRLIVGPAGTSVTLSVQREGEPKPLSFTLVRARIHIDSVEGDRRNSDGSWEFMLPGDDHLGYVHITSFGEDTLVELQRAMERLTADGLRGLVIDLRGDRGGLLNAAVGICDLFIKDKNAVIVTTRGRQKDQIRSAYRASGRAKYIDLPIAVLIDGESASASEIVAACLQDHERAVVIGERSFGKGTVQEVIDLDEGQGALRLTTASYWRPSEKNIHRRRDATPESDWGVLPNKGYEVPVDDEERGKLAAYRSQREARANNGDGQAEPPPVDRPLQKALEYLRAAR